jgi:hypothetical protein
MEINKNGRNMRGLKKLPADSFRLPAGKFEVRSLRFKV